MGLFNSLSSAFCAGLSVGLIITMLLTVMVVFIRPSRLGYKSELHEVVGRWFRLVEISAQQRLNYLEWCGKFDVNNGYELMRKDLAISADLIALHQQRWFVPHWFLAWQVKRLSGETIAELFRRCVRLSNIPFDIEERPVDKTETVTETVAGDANPDDDWDYIEEEKKNQPVAPP
jgi:hypothetical protein